MNSIETFRLNQIQNKINLVDDMIKFICFKKDAQIEYTIDDSIWDLQSTKGFNCGIVIKFKNEDKYTKVFVPFPDEFDFMIYKQVPRLLQNRLLDDIISFYKNNIRCEPIKFVYPSDRDINIQIASLFSTTSNYNCLYSYDIFSFDEQLVNSNKELFSTLDEYFDKFEINATIDKVQEKVILFINKNFVNGDPKLNDVITQFVSFIRENKTINCSVQPREISFTTFQLLNSMFNITDNINKDMFDSIYNKCIILCGSLFISLLRLSEFSNYYKQIVVKPASVQYKYISAYQQIFYLLEKSVTNAIRKISKRKKQKKDDELTNLATEIVRLPSFKFTEIYNPFTEIRTITSCEIPIDNLSNAMRSIDKSMYGLFCPVDTSDKDPGKILRATPSLLVDDVGRHQGNFVYIPLVMKLINGSLDSDIVSTLNCSKSSDIINNIITTLNISRSNINEFDTSYKKSLMNTLKINL